MQGRRAGIIRRCLEAHYVCTQFGNEEILLEFITTLQGFFFSQIVPSFLAISFFPLLCLSLFFYLAVLSLTQPVKL